MSAIIRLYESATMEIDGQQVRLGSMVRPRYLSVAGEIDQKVVTVEADSTQELWDVDDSHLGDFDFLAIYSDRDVTIEFIVDDDGDVGEMAFTLPVSGTGESGEYGYPLVLTADDSYANNTAGFAGTADVIERITVKNASASNAAQVKLIAVT